MKAWGKTTSGAGRRRIPGGSWKMRPRRLPETSLPKQWRGWRDYGLSIVGHVHDEVIIEAPIGKYKVDEVCKLMAIKPD